MEKRLQEIIEQCDAMLDGEVHDKCLYFTYSTLKDNFSELEKTIRDNEKENKNKILGLIQELQPEDYLSRMGYMEGYANALDDLRDKIIRM